MVSQEGRQKPPGVTSAKSEMGIPWMPRAAPEMGLAGQERVRRGFPFGQWHRGRDQTRSSSM